jgi:hypothetical protein
MHQKNLVLMLWMDGIDRGDYWWTFWWISWIMIDQWMMQLFFIITLEVIVYLTSLHQLSLISNCCLVILFLLARIPSGSQISFICLIRIGHFVATCFWRIWSYVKCFGHFDEIIVDVVKGYRIYLFMFIF